MGSENFSITETMTTLTSSAESRNCNIEIKWWSPNFVTLQKKTNFRGLGSAQGQNGFEQCLGLCHTDFNTKKNHGVSFIKFGEKNFFSQKYDEIRRFDGILKQIFASMRKCICFASNWILVFKFVRIFWSEYENYTNKWCLQIYQNMRIWSK